MSQHARFSHPVTRFNKQVFQLKAATKMYDSRRLCYHLMTTTVNHHAVVENCIHTTNRRVCKQCHRDVVATEIE